jgi:hypothetical protein
MESATRVGSGSSSLIFLSILGYLLLSASLPAALAQTANNHTTILSHPPRALLESAQAAQRFSDAVKGIITANPAETDRAPVTTAYVMIELPSAPPQDELPLVVAFRDVPAEILAQFYAQVCKQRGWPVLDFQCHGGRFTIIPTEDLPPGQACQVMEALLLTSCKSRS